MKAKITVALAVVAAFGMNVAANADGFVPEKKQVSHRRVYRSRHIAARPQLIKETSVTTIKTIERPVVIEAPAAPAPVAAAEVKQECITQPAVVETATPVIIDRYEKRPHYLIHLGLFPFMFDR